MLEKSIEKKMKLFAERNQGELLKLFVPGENGIPDRLLLMPGGRVAFIELKKQGEKPKKLQQYFHKQLRRKGFDVHVVDNVHTAEKVVDLYVE